MLNLPFLFCAREGKRRRLCLRLFPPFPQSALARDAGGNTKETACIVAYALIGCYPVGTATLATCQKRRLRLASQRTPISAFLQPTITVMGTAKKCRLDFRPGKWAICKDNGDGWAGDVMGADEGTPLNSFRSQTVAWQYAKKHFPDALLTVVNCI